MDITFLTFYLQDTFTIFLTTGFDNMPRNCSATTNCGEEEADNYCYPTNIDAYNASCLAQDL